MKPYQIVMAIALLGGIALQLFGDKTPSSGLAEAVVRTPPSSSQGVRPAVHAADSTVLAAASAHGKDVKTDTTILRLVPRSELIGTPGAEAFASTEGVFAGQNWNPPPPPPPPVSQAPPPPPTAPPLPFSYLGKAVSDGVWEVYLARADKVYMVRSKMVIEGTYRVETIAPPVLSLTYLPLNQIQQINIGVLD